MAGAILGFLRDAGVAEPVARRATESVVCTAAQLLAGRVETAPGLVQGYIDYAGTTAAGLETARREGFERAVTEALAAATRKARDMG